MIQKHQYSFLENILNNINKLQMKTLILILSLFLGVNTISYSQNETQDPKKDKTVKTLYTCPHHPEIVSDIPGECGICKMKLQEKKFGNYKEKYQCPKCKRTSKMHKKCSKCNIDMSLKENNMYECPKCKRTSHRSKKCSKCQMNMIQEDKNKS
jgi:predicted RNA-binding Zn-ribbon protein involved in translation (DUF1610 family)